MKIFVSYAREDRASAETVNAALNAAGFDTFLDTKELPPGQEFNARIKAAIDNSDVFIFLVSQDSVSPGSYTLTELAFAETKWRNPAGYVLPVIANEFDPANLPTYLRPINALIIRGNLEAEVVGWVQERAAGGGGDVGLTREERLKKWARLSQPPLREAKRRIPDSSIGMIAGGILIIVGLAGQSLLIGSVDHDLTPDLGIYKIVPFVFLLGALALIVFGISRASISLRRGIKPIATAVLDRESKEGSVTVHLQTLDGDRLKLEPVTKAAKQVYAGDLGWAYVSGGLLLDFISDSPQIVAEANGEDG